MEPQSHQALHLPQPTASAAGSGLTPTDNPMGAPISGSVEGYQQTPVLTPLTAQTTDKPDDLDKEWIAKAKLIVEQTRHDPYLQSREIGKLKADYLRIRYNKHIKVSPDKTT